MRYRVMFSRCIEERWPFVMLIREGEGVGGGAIPYGADTAAIPAGVDHLKGGQVKIVATDGE